MIARIWRGRGSAEGIARYVGEHFEPVVLPELRSIDGFAGADVYSGDGEVIVVTRWESRDAVRAFAGDDDTRAVVEPVVATLLDTYDDRVTHYDMTQFAL